MPFYERQPYITPLYQILLELLRGEISVPRFQRPGSEVTWTTEQRGDLLDSLFRGFPVGTVLLWSSSIPIATMSKVGGYSVRTPKRIGPARLLLDGHQRLSTLLGILGPGLAAEINPSPSYEEPFGEKWVFDAAVGEDNSRDRFRVVRGRQPKPTQIPLDILLNRPKMNEWIRNNQSLLGENGVLLAESVRDKIREYSVPVAVLATDLLEEATESFKRVNSSGTRMTNLDMVAALAYRADDDVRDQIEVFSSEYLTGDWKDLDSEDILRVVASQEGQHPMKMQVQDLANAIREWPDAVEIGVKACAIAARALTRLGIHGPAALPYAWQVVSLAAVNGLQDLRNSSLDAELCWLLVTSYGEVFRGANAAIFDRACESLRQMRSGASWPETPMARDVTRVVQPLRRFDFRSARSKLFCLVLADLFDGNSEGPAHTVLARRGVQALQTLRPERSRSEWSELVLLPDEVTISDVKLCLEGQNPTVPLRPSQLGFPSDDLTGTLEQRLATRRDWLVAFERRLVEALGLEWGDQVVES